jgi:hypothetical protein
MIVQGDHGYSLPFIAKKGPVMDLTGAAVEVAIERGGEVINKQATILSPSTGMCEVILSSNDLRYMGTYTYQWTAYFQDGRILSGDPSSFYVKNKLRDIPPGDGEKTVVLPFARKEDLDELKAYVDGIVITGGGSVVQDSATNGNIKINNQEMNVYDDSNLVQEIEALKQSGTQGPPGEDGKSAYDIWLEEGNTGTETEFLASLKGEKGDAGQSGTGGGSGILTFNTVQELQTAYPNGTSQPVWITSENSWYYWSGTVTPPADTTPPNNVTGVVASNITQTSMVIGWISVSDAVNYEIWRNGALLTTVSTTTYNATGLTAYTSYSWVIKAKDSVGNTASGSTPLLQSTLAADVEPPADTTAPVLTITPAGTFTDTKTVTMSTNETATIWYTLDDSDPITSGTRVQYTVPLTLTETDTVKAYALDSANNASSVQTVTYTKQAVTSNGYLQLDGTNRLRLPAEMGAKFVVLDVEIATPTSAGYKTIIDTRGASVASGYLASNEIGAGITGYKINGTNASRTVNDTTLPRNTRITIEVTMVNATAVSGVPDSSIQVFGYFNTAGVSGKIYGITCIDVSGNIVAKYDMSTGTLNDQSGNSYHGTIQGAGTPIWV